MKRSSPLVLIAGLLLLGGCAAPGSDRAKLEFERLREHPTTPDEDKFLPDFGSDPWTEEALRRPPGLNPGPEGERIRERCEKGRLADAGNLVAREVCPCASVGHPNVKGAAKIGDALRVALEL